MVLRCVIPQNNVFYPAMELLSSRGIWEIVLSTKHIVYQEYLEEN